MWKQYRPLRLQRVMEGEEGDGAFSSPTTNECERRRIWRITSMGTGGVFLGTMVLLFLVGVLSLPNGIQAFSSLYSIPQVQVVRRGRTTPHNARTTATRLGYRNDPSPNPDEDTHYNNYNYGGADGQGSETTPTREEYFFIDNKDRVVHGVGGGGGGGGGGSSSSITSTATTTTTTTTNEFVPFIVPPTHRRRRFSVDHNPPIPHPPLHPPSRGTLENAEQKLAAAAASLEALERASDPSASSNNKSVEDVAVAYLQSVMVGAVGGMWTVGPILYYHCQQHQSVIAGGTVFPLALLTAAVEAAALAATLSGIRTINLLPFFSASNSNKQAGGDHLLLLGWTTAVVAAGAFTVLRSVLMPSIFLEAYPSIVATGAGGGTPSSVENLLAMLESVILFGSSFLAVEAFWRTEDKLDVSAPAGAAAAMGTKMQTSATTPITTPKQQHNRRRDGNFHKDVRW